MNKVKEIIAVVAAVAAAAKVVVDGIEKLKDTVKENNGNSYSSPSADV